MVNKTRGDYITRTYLWAPDEYWEFTEEQLKDIIGRGGCGPGNIWDYLVPDKLYGVIDVQPACSIHDYMYHVGKTEKDKEYADGIFHDNMHRIILWETAGWYKDKERQTKVREECYRQADFYYYMVANWGGLSFWANKDKPEDKEVKV
jgi:hypothetical protein